MIEDDAAGTVKLNVGIINGSENGPVVALTGGMIGTHYPGINVCIRIYNEIDPSKLKGTIIIVPVMEVTGFQQGMDKSPMDGLGLNTVFPGDPEGTITRRIAYTVFKEIIKKSNYHLDLRGGDLAETILIFVYSFKTGNNEFDEITAAMTRVLGTGYYTVLPQGGPPDPLKSPRSGTLISEANNAGIHSVALIGSKGLGTCTEEDIQTCMTGAYNLFKHLKMIDGKPIVLEEPKEMEFAIQSVKAKEGGLLHLECKCGDVVPKGKILGKIINLEGKVIQELASPAEGVIDFTHPKHICRPGDPLTGVRRIMK